MVVALRSRTKEGPIGEQKPAPESQIATAQENVVQTSTPAYITKYGPYFDWWNNRLAIIGVLGPFMALPYQWYFDAWYGWDFVLQAVLIGYIKHVICGSLHHRFFSHRVFACHRITTFLLGCLTWTAFERGPLWWSSKHARHHKWTENDGVYPYHDPHSPYRFHPVYAYIGWIFHPYEIKVDWELIHPVFKTPEMFFCESFSQTWQFVEILLVYYLFGQRAMLAVVYGAQITVHTALCLNFFLHIDGKPDEPPVNGRYKSHAYDARGWIMTLLFEAVGENEHDLHHKEPWHAHHRTRLGFDVFFWCFIKPLEALGIVWDVRP